MPSCKDQDGIFYTYRNRKINQKGIQKGFIYCKKARMKNEQTMFVNRF